MPANEQTWRNTNRLHVIFGITSLAMLAATIWMTAQDFGREWKTYQKTFFARIEPGMTSYRISAEKTKAQNEGRERLQAALAQANAEVPPRALVDRFLDEARTHAADYDVASVESAFQTLAQTQVAGGSAESRALFMAAVQEVVRRARFNESRLLQERKFARADLDAEISRLGLAIGHSPQEELDSIQASIDAIRTEVTSVDLRFQDANTHRKALETVVAEIDRPVAAATKALADHDAQLEFLDTSLEEQVSKAVSPLTAIPRLPILDAFDTGPIEIKQIWLPDLLINYKHAKVARFDRCGTCHLGIERTLPGSAVEPAFAPSEHVQLTLATPSAQPTLGDEDLRAATLAEVADNDPLFAAYGMRLAAEGLVNPSDATVSFVSPKSPAALARIAPGDVIELVNDAKILDRATAVHYLLESVDWGKPLVLTVRRGLVHPFSTHPRLDLYLGSISPHKTADFGCTICHDGQGSSTSFDWASHSPNSPAEQERWRREHGWFDNHFWEYPMLPSRFVESTCLKCHHSVIELEPSPRFPDPPAPKLVQGFNLIRQYGCFGCHEISGYDGPNKRVGPDLRLAPNYTAAASQVLADPALPAELAALAQTVRRHPEDSAARKQLALSIADDQSAEGGAALTPVTHKMGELLAADADVPGTERKVGPSLRHAASKLSPEFLYDWIREPKHFRPTTRMPQFFGLHEHLRSAGGDPAAAATDTKEFAERMESVEIRGITEYLLAASQPFSLESLPAGVEPSVERGKTAFQLRGCLACHQHADFPDGKATQGPDLSLIGSKLKSPQSHLWLYSWLKDPSRYHSQSYMPDLKLEPVTENGQIIDPAADITAYLVIKNDGWSPIGAMPAAPTGDGGAIGPTDPVFLADLDALVTENLSAGYSRRIAEDYTKNGIPLDVAEGLAGDDRELAGPADTHKKLMYVGRRAVSKFGCSGCHDIPGFEDAKPIGTALADWGRKDLSQLAFEQIVPYLEQTEGAGGHGASHADLFAQLKDMPADKAYFIEKLLLHRREGFLWQKLRAPRSYDYEKTRNKTYNERLRMPRFPFKPEEIEAVATFVLGLVAEPPAARYVYAPGPRQSALLAGKRVLDKYNCGGCHTLDMETWKFDYDPSTFEEPVEIVDYPFLNPSYAPDVLAASARTDLRGLGHASLHGWQLYDDNGEPVNIGEDDAPVNVFTLWKPALINGKAWAPGVQDVPIDASTITSRRPFQGGDLARLIHPTVIEMERAVNPNAKASDAWGWVPPPLVGEGLKVQSDWLHEFLLDPYPIRPAAVLRMPKFNMTSDEASALVNYFAASDNVEYPYSLDPRTQESYLASEETRFPGRLDDALSIVTNGNYCVKCHLLGDYAPPGSVKAQAPNLDRVYRRLRPDFLRNWLANPKRLLPYTGMPVNFPVDKPIDAKLFPTHGKVIAEGTSQEQLNAVVDLLLNYDAYTKSKTSFKDRIQPVPETVAPAGE
jgi:cytochrome c551/c552